MSATANEVSRFITARALIGPGKYRMEVALHGSTVRMSLDAYAEIAEEFHENKDLVDEIRSLVKE